MIIENVKDFNDYYLVNGEISIPKDEANKEYRKVQVWLESNSLTPAYDISELKNIRIGEIKAEAGRRITEIYPEYKQINIGAEVLQVLVDMKERAATEPTDAERALLTIGRDCKEYITGISVKSNELEASLDAMTLQQLEAFDPTDDANWV